MYRFFIIAAYKRERSEICSHSDDDRDRPTDKQEEEEERLTMYFNILYCVTM